MGRGKKGEQEVLHNCLTDGMEGLSGESIKGTSKHVQCLAAALFLCMFLSLIFGGEG